MLSLLLVPGAGIEPARIAPLVFETSASTDSAIRAGVLFCSLKSGRKEALEGFSFSLRIAKVSDFSEFAKLIVAFSVLPVAGSMNLPRISLYLYAITKTAMEQINIYSGKRPVSRIVTAGSMKELNLCLEPYRKTFAVVDRNVADKCPAVAHLADDLRVRGVDIKLIMPSEEAKTLETVMDICAWLLECNADRDALVLAIGGGITTDMAGFAASIYKRGVRFAYVPTTLLSQVDAAIGGKTGVNFDRYKNILGVIRQPEFTFICPQVLESLPMRDFTSGAAEMLKTFVIEDGGNYRKAADLFFDMAGEYHLEVLLHCKHAEPTWSAILKKRMKELAGLITAAARVKAGVVSRDQFERGERRKLNLGHTFAHAIETLAQRDGGERFRTEDGVGTAGVTHGEAVAMGMVLAARLADRYYRNDCSDPTALESQMSNDLWDSNVPCFCPYSIEEMAQVMKKDKKAEGGKIHFVLPKAIGQVEIVDLTVEEVCRLMA